ncbi:MAG: tRNA (adenosine(37)-N6)-dimethylallyltransferase MiaA [Flavobacteriales bacterium]|nr:tRNA (adenosine(37)-N6)-dimethylallyltransferase MiaA [Flavobacteriales bacterium]
MTRNGTLVVVGGPTASGKTHAAATLARSLGTEVISADSRQFYRAMRIGTARPRAAELLGVEHHFLGHLGLEVEWNAGAFARAAEPVLQHLLVTHGTAVLVGGSGLYIDALLKGLDPLPTAQVEVRDELRYRAEQGGMPAMLEELKALDRVTWERIDRANPQRVIRALEVCLITGRPFSSQRTTPSDRDDVQIVRLAMDLPRSELYQRIDQRVNDMLRDGLVEEVRSLLPFRGVNALRTVGYRELFAHFEGTLTLDEAIASIKQHTRNFAKRQLTWLRRDPQWQRVHPQDHSTHLHLAIGR